MTYLLLSVSIIFSAAVIYRFKHRSVILLLAYGASLVYSSPLFIGITRSFESRNSGNKVVEIADEVYYLYSFSFAISGLFMLFYFSVPYFKSVVSDSRNRVLFPTRLFAIFLFFIVFWLGYFDYRTISNDFEMNQSIRVLVRSSIVWLFVISMTRKDLIAASIIWVVVLFWFLAGDRSLLAVMLVVSLYYWLSGQRSIFTKISFALLALIILSLGKFGYIYFSGQNLSIDDFYETVVFGFEPAGILYQLQYVVENGMKITSIEFFQSVLGNLLLIPSFFGVEIKPYNLTLQEVTGASWGLAGNPIASGYAFAGYFGVFCVLSIKFSFLFAANSIVNSAKSPYWRAATLTIALSVIAFYERNEIGNIFAIGRHVLISAIILYPVSVYYRLMVFISKGYSR